MDETPPGTCTSPAEPPGTTGSADSERSNAAAGYLCPLTGARALCRVTGARNCEPKTIAGRAVLQLGILSGPDVAALRLRDRCQEHLRFFGALTHRPRPTRSRRSRLLGLGRGRRRTSRPPPCSTCRCCRHHCPVARRSAPRERYLTCRGQFSDHFGARKHARCRVGARANSRSSYTVGAGRNAKSA